MMCNLLCKSRKTIHEKSRFKALKTWIIYFFECNNLLRIQDGPFNPKYLHFDFWFDTPLEQGAVVKNLISLNLLIFYAYKYYRENITILCHREWCKLEKPCHLRAKDMRYITGKTWYKHVRMISYHVRNILMGNIKLIVHIIFFCLFMPLSFPNKTGFPNVSLYYDFKIFIHISSRT